MVRRRASNVAWQRERVVAGKLQAAEWIDMRMQVNAEQVVINQSWDDVMGGPTKGWMLTGPLHGVRCAQMPWRSISRRGIQMLWPAVVLFRFRRKRLLLVDSEG